jgi:hypothetical protein
MKTQNWLRFLRNPQKFIIYLRNMGDQDKSWAAHICCHKYKTNPSQWLNGKRYAMPFAVRVVWREPSNHRYFCVMTPVSGGMTKKKMWTTVYPNIPSPFLPFPHGEGISIPEPPKEFTIDSDKYEGELTSGSPEPLVSTEPRLPW